jgi:hypothetical protein
MFMKMVFYAPGSGSKARKGVGVFKKDIGDH